MANTDLVRIGEAKEYLGTADSEDDELAIRITGLTLELERRLSCYFVQRSRVEYHAGGSKRIYTERYPIASVTSIADPASNTITSDYYIVRKKRYLEHYSFFPQAVASSGQRTDWTVTFVCGHFADQASIPVDLRRAFLKLLEGTVENPTEASSVGVGDLSISYGASPGNASRSADLISAAVRSMVEYRGDFL